jgi:cytochrome c biogenesis protein CcmG, thiol:disulfide interchange protein DsbE
VSTRSSGIREGRGSGDRRRTNLNRLAKPAAIAAAAMLVGFVSYAIVAAASAQPRRFPSVPPPSRLGTGRRAPDFTLPTLAKHDTVALRGQSATPLVVNFFASWCDNCVAELDAFGRVSNEASGVRFIGIDSLDSNPSLAKALLARAHIAYSVGVDHDGTVASHYLVSALPVTFFVSRSGVVEGEIFGQATSSQLVTWVHRLGGSIRR